MGIGTKIWIWLGIALVIPMALNAAQTGFMVSITITNAGGIQIVLMDDPDQIKEMLETFSADAVFFANLALNKNDNPGVLVNISESEITAYNQNKVAQTVKTFSKPVPELGQGNFVVGGYIPKGGSKSGGVFESEATVEVLFQ